MTKGAKKHPPKKKHPTRPRPEPPIALTDDERIKFARQEFDKAETHLNEAELLAKAGTTPNACAHSAYYAMYHCASAAILAAGGVGQRKSVPASHKHVIEHYGKLVAGEQGLLAETGLILSRAQTDRDTADYDLVKNVSPQDAAATTSEARKFVDACSAKWRFR